MAQRLPESQSQRNSPQNSHHQTSDGQIVHYRAYPLSVDSSITIPSSIFYSNDFMLGAGMVIIQPSTGKVVCCWDDHMKYWFLPKGRKDVGESLETAAKREAYEESGYRVEFLPLLTPTNAPLPPGSQRTHNDPNTEPIYMSNMSWPPRRRFMDQPPRAGQDGGVYFTFWYVGQIPENAVRELDTGMINEKHFVSHILPIEEALHNLSSAGGEVELIVMKKAYNLWLATKEALQHGSSAPSDSAS
ncbi:hypothetical protein C8Q75DRAFT_726623 [Abortiporus biennis]|nr:hypothetical protein C8Q75DRAFT_726623 [Abortiporus biennis]